MGVAYRQGKTVLLPLPPASDVSVAKVAGSILKGKRKSETLNKQVQFTAEIIEAEGSGDAVTGKKWPKEKWTGQLLELEGSYLKDEGAEPRGKRRKVTVDERDPGLKELGEEYFETEMDEEEEEEEGEEEEEEEEEEEGEEEEEEGEDKEEGNEEEEGDEEEDKEGDVEEDEEGDEEEEEDKEEEEEEDKEEEEEVDKEEEEEEDKEEEEEEDKEEEAEEEGDEREKDEDEEAEEEGDEQKDNERLKRAGEVEGGVTREGIDMSDDSSDGYLESSEEIEEEEREGWGCQTAAGVRVSPDSAVYVPPHLRGLGQNEKLRKRLQGLINR